MLTSSQNKIQIEKPYYEETTYRAIIVISVVFVLSFLFIVLMRLLLSITSKVIFVSNSMTQNQLLVLCDHPLLRQIDDEEEEHIINK